MVMALITLQTNSYIEEPMALTAWKQWWQKWLILSCLSLLSFDSFPSFSASFDVFDSNSNGKSPLGTVLGLPFKQFKLSSSGFQLVWVGSYIFKEGNNMVMRSGAVDFEIEAYHSLDVSFWQWPIMFVRPFTVLFLL